MTTRRLNYTGCVRILRSDVQISVDASDPPTFEHAFDLAGYEFPADARVVIEAQAHWTLMRFDVGAASDKPDSAPVSLSEFESPDGIRFRLKVIGVGDIAGLILGEADGVSAADADGREDSRSFLAVQPAELGDVAWRLSFAGTEPLLQINEKLGDWRSFMRRPEVRALVLPELFRQLLAEALDNPPDSEAADTWQAATLGMVAVSAGPRPTGSDPDALEVWIDAAVSAFARRHRFLRGVLDMADGAS